MKIKNIHIIGAVFTIVLGTILHFAYSWSGSNDVVALFSAVNESVWEHLKLLFFPVIAFAIIEYIYYGRNYNNFICAKFISVLIGMIFIVISFYTYSGIIGSNFVIIDVLIFIISVIITYRLSLKILNSDKYKSKNCNILCTIGIMFFISLFFTFTFSPPKLNLFMDSLTKTYGA
ncbi:hypothetical protein JYG23_14015 [Sedimentibacter sp. zth1]|uniref:DUF6512 family protein n=1 Tax=Sedimentibacter sp. zth1 TaxID=2816908 RepID=UPI001A90FAD7|nr:DUF6512 family protein [Sedimentibacter sp. zth1]QSX05760.1 hypothetical protein JYG23_14015 [Sedimentibacter sp. zth1]